MRRFFALIALAAVTLFSCEENNPQGGGNKIDPTLKIKLTSESVMNFNAAGGEGVITYEFEYIDPEAAYTRTSPAPILAEAATAVDWINDLRSNEGYTITFSVEPNNDEQERSATIKVSYGEHSFMVMLKQQGSKNADVTFHATHLGGTYYGKFLNSPGYNYFIILSDMQPKHYQSKPYGATEYRFDIYSEVGAAFDNQRRVPVGVYHIDHSRSGKYGTIDGYRDCSYLYTDNAATPYNDATLTVTETSIIAEVTFFDGQVHRIVYEGDCYLEDYTENTYADVYPVSQYTKDINFDIDGGYIAAYYRGDWLDTGCDTWFLHMIEQKAGFSGVYLIMDLIVPKAKGGFNNKEGFVGEYSFINTPQENYEFTFPGGRLRDDSQQLHAWYLYCQSGQVDMSKAAPLTSGTIKVEMVDGDCVITIDSTDDNGNKIQGTFRGQVGEYDNQSVDM